MIQGQLVKDLYSIQLQNFIYFMLNSKSPPLVQQEPDPRIREKDIKRIRQIKKVYTIQKCKQRNFHVVLISSRKPVPMLKRTLQMLKSCHKNHRDTSTLIKNMLQQYENYCLNFAKKYAYQYVLKCSQCKRNVVDKVPYWHTHTSDIFEEIQQAQQNQIQFTQKQDKYQDLKYDFQCCPYDCQKDHYDEYYSFLLDLYMSRKKLRDTNLKLCQKKKINRDLCQCKVIKCQKNTIHLWRLGYKYRSKSKVELQGYSDFQIYKRVPMQQQKLLVAKILHGDRHRKYQKMIQGISHLPFLYNVMKQYLQNNPLNCQTCSNYSRIKQSHSLKQNSTISSVRQQKIKQIYEQIQDEQVQVTNKHGKLRTLKIFNKNRYKNREQSKKLKLISKVKRLQKSIDFRGLLVKSFLKKYESPNVIVISTSKMQKNYHNYGDCLFFQSFSHFIDTKQCWQTFFFSGVDQSKNQLIFATCLIDKPSFQAYFYAFRNFFQLMYNEYPQTICTPYDPKIGQAISSLTFYSQQQKLRKVKHFYQWKSAISVFNQMITSQNKPSGLISKIIEAMTTPSLARYTQVMSILQKQLGTYSDLYNTLELIKQKICWTQLSPSFVGFGLDYARTQNVLKKLKRNLSICTTSMQFINDFSKINSKKANRYENDQQAQQKNYSAPELYSIQGQVCDKIMQCLTQRCIQSNKIISIQLINQLQLQVKQQFGIFIVRYNILVDHWSCSCRQLQKTGLPCTHLIKIIKQMGGQIKYYINQRWFLNNYVDQFYYQYRQDSRYENQSQLFSDVYGL